MATHQEDARQIHVQSLTPGGEGHVDKGNLGENSRGVDEYVNRPEKAFCLLHFQDHGVFIRYVRRHAANGTDLIGDAFGC